MRKRTVSVIAALCLCLLLVTLVGFLFSGSIGNYANDLRIYLGLAPTVENRNEIFTPDPALFTSPIIPGYSPIKKENAPIRKTSLQPGFSVTSNYLTSDFLRGGVSYFLISIKNEGRNPIFVERYGVSVNTSINRIYSKACGTSLIPGQEKCLGVVAVQVPDEKEARFNVALWLLACTSQGKWHEYEPYFLSGFAADLKPMPEKINSIYRYDPSFYFKLINKLVEPVEPSVKIIAYELARSYPGAYNIYQICAIFDYVRDEIKYVSDPRGHDFWPSADTTLKVGAGNCKDKAILLSSMLEAVGGTTRIYMTDTHAFTAVYIGNGTKETEATVKGIRAYYGDVDVYYLTDKYGSWLMLDPTSSFYAGDLPGTAAQVKVRADGENKTQRAWTFLKTSEVKVIDISPR